MNPRVGTHRGRPRSAIAVMVAVLALGAGAATFQLMPSQPATADQDPGRDHLFRALGNGEAQERRPQLRAPGDALSPEEVSYATHLARTHASLTQATNASGEPSVEILRVFSPDYAEGMHERIATLQAYDYRKDQAWTLSINLATGTIATAKNVTTQPALSTHEAEVATAIALQHRPPLSFVTQFEQATGMPLVDGQQLSFRASPFLPSPATQQARSCVRHRCAQLMLRAPNGAFLDTSDFVVDLSAGSIVEVKQ